MSARSLTSRDMARVLLFYATGDVEPQRTNTRRLIVQFTSLPAWSVIETLLARWGRDRVASLIAAEITVANPRGDGEVLS